MSSTDAQKAIVIKAAKQLVREQLAEKQFHLLAEEVADEIAYQNTFFDLYEEEHAGDPHPDEDLRIFELGEKKAEHEEKVDLHQYGAALAKEFLLSLYPTLTQDPGQDYLDALNGRLKYALAQDSEREAEVAEDVRAMILHAEANRNAWPTPVTAKRFSLFS